MRYLLTFLSVSLALWGITPFKMAINRSTENIDHIVVEQRECGCPCANAVIRKGSVSIPDSLLKYVTPGKNEINLDIADPSIIADPAWFNAELFVAGKVTGIDTILCTPENCEYVPRFKPDSWGFIDYVPRVWFFPGSLVLLYFVNTLIFVPLLIIQTVRRIAKHNTGI